MNHRLALMSEMIEMTMTGNEWRVALPIRVDGAIDNYYYDGYDNILGGGGYGGATGLKRKRDQRRQCQCCRFKDGKD